MERVFEDGWVVNSTPAEVDNLIAYVRRMDAAHPEGYALGTAVPRLSQCYECSQPLFGEEYRHAYSSDEWRNRA